ncbi:class I adenylate-forming enzyme family protein [Microbispora sp. H11081]|uniref:class I adenylate-forming enzyme family protein n=1 Tax=Microbispora sp. H11081 TaxID=2729107 RepID=UPI0014736AE6|nr:fatty acid--CoA ligase family protein [Microbispora sp. H11081]
MDSANIITILTMAAQGFGDRVALGPAGSGTTYADLLTLSGQVGDWLAGADADQFVLVDVNSDLMPALLFGAALAGKPFVPVNYRLADDRLRRIVERTSPSLVVAEPSAVKRVEGIAGVTVVPRDAVPGLIAQTTPRLEPVEGSDIAVLLFTSGTTGEPKAAVLRHDNLFSYIVSTVDFLSADADECALISVPPYHIAGVAAVLSSTFAGRRIYYLEQFNAEEWVKAAAEQSATHAMVVPTMLGRIIEVLERTGERLPALRHLSYGGGHMPTATIAHALELLPHVDFTNAYGLTETSSTIAVLTPDDHRVANASADPAVRMRLGSVGRPIPSIELFIAGPDGKPVAQGESGEIWVRGTQVSGEYLGVGSTLKDGWFRTRDAGRLDADGYLYVEGRLDDVIVRGGENMSPGEIEDVLRQHPAVREAAVVGIPDSEWGEAIAAMVVCHEGESVSQETLQKWVRASLRSSRVPELVVFRDALPYSETGKLLRREIRSEISPSA